MAPTGGSCGAAAESAGRRLASQLEDGLKETLERLRTEDRLSATAGNSVAAPDNLEWTLAQLLSAAQAQAARLAKLESGCFSGPGAGKGGSRNGGFPHADGAKHWEQEVTPQMEPLDGTLAEVCQTKAELEEVLRSLRRRNLPAGEDPSPALYLSLHLSLLSSPFLPCATQTTFHLQGFSLR